MFCKCNTLNKLRISSHVFAGRNTGYIIHFAFLSGQRIECVDLK